MTTSPSLTNLSGTTTAVPPSTTDNPHIISKATQPIPASTDPTAFQFPPHYSFPPFFTLQPVLATRTSQLHSWSQLIQSYCHHHRIFTLTLIDALQTPLFSNARLSRRLSLRDARSIIQWMTTLEGQNRAEWISASKNNKKSSPADEEGMGKCWIYWRRPEEWAVALEESRRAMLRGGRSFMAWMVSFWLRA
ncbi:winged helix DNA-binding domain-containing protein [Lojkania enalia]|uniref:Vacuolar protein-sorting-associated protein 25 n=1 Tax=Lojkania enalia TaxID=147567 RepID=A0A9P4N3I4_9PLEO|nr:winged helix DNA-binding domain-containing protein [Didymosphaeria enalia]